MQIPKRKSQERRKYGGPADDFLSPSALKKIEADLRRLQAVSRPRAVEDLSRAREMGDLSENAAYSEAKGRLMKIDSLIFEMKEKLKNAVVIRPGADAEGRARIGSTVVVMVNGKEKSYELTGSQETDPSTGRISHLSPLGRALLGRKAGEAVTVKGPVKTVDYRITAVR
jgi:transcription elongation factor GreA